MSPILTLIDSICCSRFHFVMCVRLVFLALVHVSHSDLNRFYLLFQAHPGLFRCINLLCDEVFQHPFLF